MSDDFSDRRDGPRTTSFEEWLEQQAESQGISRQELFERLVSSYWTLNELVQLLDDSGNATSLADIHPEGDELGDDGDLGAAPTVGSGDRRNEDRGQREDRNRKRRDRRTREERRKRDDRGRDRDRRRRDGDRIEDLHDRIETLHDRIDGLESELDDERERGQSQDKALEAVADRLSGIETDLEELATESEAARESLSTEYESLADRLDDLEADIDGRHKQLANEQERLRSRLDAEFDDLETILEHLVTQTDDLDAGLEAVEQRHDDELSRLQWEREALQSVLSDAGELDAHAGECEVCGERVDLDLLAEPYCSACDSLLTGVEERDKWLFLSDTVVTAEENPSGNDRTDPAGGSGRGDPPRDGDDEQSALGRTGDRDRHAGGGRDAAEREPTQPTDAAAADDPTDSQFSFGDTGSDTTAGGGPGSEAEASADDPFGDLKDLKREERRTDGE